MRKLFHTQNKIYMRMVRSLTTYNLSERVSVNITKVIQRFSDGWKGVKGGGGGKELGEMRQLPTQFVTGNRWNTATEIVARWVCNCIRGRTQANLYLRAGGPTPPGSIKLTPRRRQNLKIWSVTAFGRYLPRALPFDCSGTKKIKTVDATEKTCPARYARAKELSASPAATLIPVAFPLNSKRSQTSRNVTIFKRKTNLKMLSGTCFHIV